MAGAIRWYNRLLARRPWLVLAAVFCFSALCLVLPFAIEEKLPDFSDPQIGFEARGTPLAQRLTAWKNLMESSGPRGYFSINPLEYYYYLQDLDSREKSSGNRKNGNETSASHAKRHRHKKQQQHLKNKRKHERELAASKEQLSAEMNRSSDNQSRVNSSQPSKEEDEFFCNNPTPDYSKLVVTSPNEEFNAWSLEAIQAQCEIDRIVRSTSPHFTSLCQRKLKSSELCCRTWSPANYVALLANRTSCESVTGQDVQLVRSLLERCAFFYRKGDLTADCTENLTCQLRVPTQCQPHNAAYHLLHYLLDADYLGLVDNATNEHLGAALLILPVAASSAALDYYADLARANLTAGDFHVAAMDFGLKSTLFDRLLVSDSVYLLFGFCFVTVCIWFYTESWIVTLSTLLIVVFSCAISYAIYALVLGIKLFPFMNLLTLVVAVGIGSDDTFIFCKLWECNRLKRENSNGNDNEANLLQLVDATMRHAVPSILVTSLTTSVAFFASIVSNVTAVNCFSLFSGMTVIVNFFLMITWFPASVVVAERWRNYELLPAGSSTWLSRWSRFNAFRYLKIGCDLLMRAFSYLLAKTVIIFNGVWFALFLSLGLGCCFVVFVCPGLQLPDSQDFQLLAWSHPFEQYDLVYAKRFWFERSRNDDASYVLPMRFVWGVLPRDTGSYLDPRSRGELVFDEAFDVASPESQLWLSSFCKNLRAQPFYQSTLGPLLPNCFVESLQAWMERSCEDPIDPAIDYSPCCRSNAFPYEPDVLKHCAARITAEINRTPTHLWNFRSSGGSTLAAGLKFRKQNDTLMKMMYESRANLSTLNQAIPDIKVVVVEYDSTFNYSLSFAEMDSFYSQVESWMQLQLAKAPPGMANGWFVSYLDFYELQRTLYHGTIWAIVVSMGLAFTVLAFVTLNPLVSLFAMVAVGGSICVTVACLILADWKLNVLESVAVSTAIGLAVDFSLHYSVAYRAAASTAKTRVARVEAALRQMAGPTLMAGLTTGAAGAMMLPSQVLAYVQIGVFLVTIMSVSWLYATFFLCSLLTFFGPTAQFGQFSFPKALRPRASFRVEFEEIDAGIPMTDMRSEAEALPLRQDEDDEDAAELAIKDANVCVTEVLLHAPPAKIEKEDS
ncbi:hypothetical protein TKK_0019098 [Trichogramma kaykai]|uniref:SSD domain-containing protein n=1 Tax=Trichogramma kaykai TaxID=54128 RepID=A0ABD2VVI4_9HYME